MYYYGYNSGYSYGSPNCCGGYNQYPQYGYGYGYGYGYDSQKNQPTDLMSSIRKYILSILRIRKNN